MKLEHLELRRLRMELVAPFRTSFGTQSERDILLVRAVSSGSEGWGECVTMASPVYSSEYTDNAHHVLRTHLLPRLLALGDITAAGVQPALAHVQGHRMAKAAAEMAILDGELQQAGMSLSRYLGSTRTHVACGVSIGIVSSIDELLAEVERQLGAGYQRIKLKIEPGWDILPVAAVRERFGDIVLQVDANAAYSLADAQLLSQLDQFQLELIEQPLPEEDLLGHAKLAAVVRTPLCLDESIVSARAAADAIELGACSVVNIKAGRVGGYLEARRVHDVCAAHGVPVWCGGMLETGLGRAANLALSALPNCTLPGDTSASSRYWRQDLTAPFVLGDDGTMQVPRGPGLGAAPLPELLAERTTSVEAISL